MRLLPLAALVLGLLGASFPAAAAAPDPWSRVPALPTGCYREDGFSEQVSAADEAVKNDLQRQSALNG